MRYLTIAGLCLLVAACEGPTSSPTAPVSSTNLTAHKTRTDKHDAVVEITYTKWFPSLDLTSLLMTGFTGGDVVGTFAGEVLIRIVTGDNIHLKARYEVIDPRGRHSFKAIIEGDQGVTSGAAVLNGVVTEGWLLGAPVHVAFQRFAPCAFATRPPPANACFQGTISVTKPIETPIKRGGPVEVTYTKWFPSLDLTSLLMAGFTGGNVVGTFAGEVLVRTPLPSGSVHLKARYSVIDARGRHSFTAIIQGEQDPTGHAVLDGVVTEGWLIGGSVHVVFQRRFGCVFATRPAPADACFEGTISVTPRHHPHQSGHGRHEDERGHDDR